MDKTLSLEQIENDVWPAPDTDTYLVTAVHALRRKPVATLTTEDLRIIIGQQLSLEALVPLALEALEEDPFREGDMYPGDLFVAVLRVSQSYWTANPMQRAALDEIVNAFESLFAPISAAIAEFRQA